MYSPEPYPLRVGLLWHSPNSGNLGVGALTLANMRLIGEACERVGRRVEFTIIGWVDEGSFYPQLHGVRVVALSGRQILSRKGFAAAVKDCDLVVDIGAGDSFTDLYGLKRFGYQACTKAIVLALGRPLVLAPQTLGPFASRLVRWSAERLIGASHACFARDAASADSIAGYGGRQTVKVMTDVAFALPSTPVAKSTDSVRVGLNFSALLFCGGYSGKNEFGLRVDYRGFVRQILDAFKAFPGVEIVLIPHVIAPQLPVEDDLALCRRLAADAGLSDPPHFTDPIMAKCFIASCDFLVGSRMHACIAAVSSGVATAPVAYSRKFAALFEGIGYDRTIDAREVDTEAAVREVLQIFHDRRAAAAEAKRAAHCAQGKLADYVDALADIVRQMTLRAKREA